MAYVKLDSAKVMPIVVVSEHRMNEIVYNCYELRLDDGTILTIDASIVDDTINFNKIPGLNNIHQLHKATFFWDVTAHNMNYPAAGEYDIEVGFTVNGDIIFGDGEKNPLQAEGSFADSKGTILSDNNWPNGVLLIVQ